MPRVLLCRYHFESLDMYTFSRIPLVDRILAKNYWQGFQGTKLECSVYEGRKQETGKGKADGVGKGRRGYKHGYKDLKNAIWKPAIIESSNNICINK